MSKSNDVGNAVIAGFLVFVALPFSVIECGGVQTHQGEARVTSKQFHGGKRNCYELTLLLDDGRKGEHCVQPEEFSHARIGNVLPLVYTVGRITGMIYVESAAVSGVQTETEPR